MRFVTVTSVLLQSPKALFVWRFDNSKSWFEFKTWMKISLLLWKANMISNVFFTVLVMLSKQQYKLSEILLFLRPQGSVPQIIGRKTECHKPALLIHTASASWLDYSEEILCFLMPPRKVWHSEEEWFQLQVIGVIFLFPVLAIYYRRSQVCVPSVFTLAGRFSSLDMGVERILCELGYFSWLCGRYSFLEGEGMGRCWVIWMERKKGI